MTAVPKHWADVYVDELRLESERMKAYGDERGAKMCEETARQIEQRRAAHEDEEITAVQAAAESGYSEQQMRNLRRQKIWSGRRRDLPRRPAFAPVLSGVRGDVAKEHEGQLNSLSIADRVGRSSNGASHRRSVSR